MLDYLRNSAKGWLIKGLLILVAASFMVWGVWGREDSGSGVVATMDGREISYTEYKRTYDNIYDYYRKANKGNMSGDFWKKMIKAQAMNTLIMRRLQLAYVDDLGIIVSDKELAHRIRKQEVFQREGTFDRRLYINLLRSNRLTTGDYEKSFRNDIKIQKVKEIITGSVLVSKKEVLDDYTYNNEKISSDYLTLPLSFFKKKVEVTDEKLQAFYDSSKERFKKEEQISAELLVSNPSDFKKEIKITEDKIADYYEKNREQFRVQDRIKARHILLRLPKDADEKKEQEAREKGEKIVLELKSGADFAETAKKYSEGPTAPRGGDLGFFSRGRMVKPFDDVAFSLKEGEISELVRTQFGFHLIKVDKIEKEKIQSLKEVKGRIELNLTLAEEKRMAREALDQVKKSEKLEKADFKEIGEKYSPLKTEVIKLSQNDPAHSVLGRKVFSLKKDEVSDIVEERNRFYIMRFKEKHDSFTPPLDEIKEEVKDAFIEDEAKKIAGGETDGLQEELKGGKSLNQLAAELTLQKANTGFVARNGVITSLGGDSRGFTAKAFTLKEGELGSFKGTDKHYLFVIKEKKGIDLNTFKEEEDKITATLLQEKRNDFFNQWLEKQSEKAEKEGRLVIAEGFK